ncbi:hypothetical protein F2Q68_00018503 [Brassica cretica]|uniref:Uncharacterized protein n=2 Tax=Brassica cretica TaxID=69181 RepID=A0A3N6QCD4_BRACR|nr:hypothetical protein F2Q68_00018503 [Brassica cretica]KAF3500921.1 hypothetical protein F2Q69_00039346 [Brassica cretica]KAF3569454.1 hypothetical protein DY000_02010705 [Brassica cretica]
MDNGYQTKIYGYFVNPNQIQCTIGQGTCPLCWMQAIQQLQTDMSEAQSNVMHMSPPGRRLPLA